MENKIITVTSPLLPSLEELLPLLQDIWERKWITNQGHYHELFEQALCDYLKVPYISLFTNGTLPLMCALQALRITGEVITTPFSFVATTHSLWWNGIKPVFVDIDPVTCNLDPDKIEAAITPKTTAIMPVHVYGVPCDTRRIQEIADKYGLKVIYDAAHAFGVFKGNESILTEGDISTLSFHATKVFNTIEGGALICKTKEMKQRIDYLKNFGFEDEVTVVAPGINGKMDEVRSAYGLLNLKQVDAAIERRKQISQQFDSAFASIEGIKIIDRTSDLCVRHNYAYYPIFVDTEQYGISRDELYFRMKDNGILARRYFYPLITDFSTYKGLESATVDNLPVATRVSNEVICLPIYATLEDEDVQRIINFIRACKK